MNTKSKKNPPLMCYYISIKYNLRECAYGKKCRSFESAALRLFAE